jgi:hypothetical protein
MKKPTRKLLLRSETIRALRALDNLDLARAAGGDVAPVIESGKICSTLGVVATSDCG